MALRVPAALVHLARLDDAGAHTWSAALLADLDQRGIALAARPAPAVWYDDDDEGGGP